MPAHIAPQIDVKKWRNSVPFVPIASACCTCVPGLLPLLPCTAKSGPATPATGAAPKEQSRRVDRRPVTEAGLTTGQLSYVIPTADGACAPAANRRHNLSPIS